jgi:DNA modification methylase
MILWASKSAKGSADRYVFNYDDMKQRNDGRQMKNVWRLPAPGAEEKRHGRHPTQKPLALIERCIAASTLPGQIVLDQIRTVDQSRLVKKLGRIDAPTAERVLDVLQEMFAR